MITVFEFISVDKKDHRSITIHKDGTITGMRHYDGFDSWSGEPRVIWDSKYTPTKEEVERLSRSDKWKIESIKIS